MTERLRWWCLLLTAVLVVLVAASGCGGRRASGTDSRGPGSPEPLSSTIDDDYGADRNAEAASTSATRYFDELSAQSGFDFVHENGQQGAFHMAEISGSGVALIDYDLDGDLDLYLVQSGTLPGGERAGGGDRLFRNNLGAAALELTFTDVTSAAGELGTGYGMGAAVGDYNQDGWPDLYVTALNGNQLLKNNGNGTFLDVTKETGTQEERWSVPSAFLDYDGDGWLDLYVGNYMAYGSVPPVCKDFSGKPDYCGPESHAPLPDRLLRNLGDGTFKDVSTAVGFNTHGNGDQAQPSPALGVVVSDFDASGTLDLYVGNDGRANHLWLQEDGRFQDLALVSGCALNIKGQSEATMGIDLSDVDRDGDLDLFLTHLVSETNTLYRNHGSGQFDDSTLRMKLGAASRLHTSFGTGFLDFDLDGWPDLFVANGAVRKIEALARAQDPFPFHEENQLFRNLGGTSFEALNLSAEPAGFSASEVSRGVALGDLDNDGDVDIVVSNNNDRARVFLGRASQIASAADETWLGARLATSTGGEGLRDEPGSMARLRATDVAGMRVSRLERSRIEGSYASSNDPRVIFALRGLRGPFSIDVQWPNGALETFGDLEVGEYWTLVKGRGNLPQSSAPRGTVSP